MNTIVACTQKGQESTKNEMNNFKWNSAMLYGRNGIKTDPFRTEKLTSDDKGARLSQANGQFKQRHVTWLKELPQILKNACFRPQSREAINFWNVCMHLFLTVYIPEELSHRILSIRRKAHFNAFILKTLLPLSFPLILFESVVR